MTDEPARTFLVGAAFLALLALPAPGRSATPIGWLDAADTNVLSGWVCDPGDPSRPLDVHFYATGTHGMGACHREGTEEVCFIGGGRADVDRPDVAAACGGSAGHGFRISTPAYVVDAYPHKIYAYAFAGPAAHNPRLSGSPRTYTSAAPAVTRLWSQPRIGSSDELSSLIVQPYGRPPCTAGAPDDVTKVQVASANCTAMSQQLDWRVWDFTGFIPPAPVFDWQRGISNSWYGGTAVQSYDDTIALQHQPESTGAHYQSDHDSWGGLNTLTLVHNRSPANYIRPWEKDRRNRLRFSGLVWVHAAEKIGNAAAYVSFVLKFRSLVQSNQFVWLTVNLFDLNRPDQLYKNKVFADFYPAGGGYAIVQAWMGDVVDVAGTPVRPRYVSQQRGSADPSTAVWPTYRYVGFEINGDQFADALREAKNLRCNGNPCWPGMTDDPAHYVWDHLNVQSEIFLSTRSDHAWVGATFRDMAVELLRY